MDLATFLVRQYSVNIGMTRRMLDQVTSDLTQDELNWQARPGHHSIWHHVWHMFLSNDYYFAYAMQTVPVWEASNWRERIDLTPMARVFDYPGNASNGPVPRFVIADVPDELVDELQAPALPAYLAYVDELIATTTDVLRTASEDQLKRRIQFYEQGEIPAFVLATGLSHSDRHLGMIEDVRGLMRGPGQGSASI
jgi:hypothetical protein